MKCINPFVPNAFPMGRKKGALGTNVLKKKSYFSIRKPFIKVLIKQIKSFILLNHYHLVLRCFKKLQGCSTIYLLVIFYLWI